MHEILRGLGAGAHVLDLGSGAGSYDAGAYPATTIRVDVENHAGHGPSRFVQADGRSLPFRERSFDAVISNHSLEHSRDPEAFLCEAGRVLKDGGAFYVALPDASTVTERIYRWIAGGGGHVTGFTSCEDVVDMVQRATSLPLAGKRLLCTSLTFLDRQVVRGWSRRRLYLLGGGSERLLVILTYLLRVLDAWVQTRTCVYGWAFYFGTVEEEIDGVPWSNVCVRCGSGHSSASLISNDWVKRSFLWLRSYRCPVCGLRNLFTDDRWLRNVDRRT